jgi:tetratricopeptide (TPR) repeat protein
MPRGTGDRRPHITPGTRLELRMDDVVGAYRDGMATIRWARATVTLCRFAAAAAEVDLLWLERPPRCRPPPKSRRRHNMADLLGPAAPPTDTPGTARARLLRAAAALRDIGRLEDAEAVLAAAGAAASPAADPAAAIAAVHAARDAGRLDEAAALLAAARAAWPEDDELVIESGWLAHIRRDWPQAADWWQTVRTRTPWHLVGYVNGAIAARETDDIDAAEDLLVQAAARFPDQPDIAIEHAALAQHAGDWNAATARWQDVRARFPDQPAAYTGAARALREQSQFAAAEALLREAAARFPASETIAAEYGWLAHIAHDWPEAATRWAALRANFPQLSVGWTCGAVALREQQAFDAADALLQDALARFPADPGVWQEYAWIATARRNWTQAAARWAQVRAHFPDLPEAWLREAVALSETWDYAAAEARLEAGIARFPDHADLALEHARLALAQSRLDEAAARYAALVERFPTLADAHLGHALALRNQFRLPEAEAALVHAQQIAPQDARLWLEHALLPVFPPLPRDRDPDRALQRLAALVARFPDFLAGTLAAIRLLREQGHAAEAEQLAGRGMEHLSQHAEPALEHAALAQARGDHAAAIERHAAICRRFPEHVGALIGYAQAVAAAGRLDEAEALLAAARDRFAHIPAAHVAHAEIAMQRNDWPEALARWTAGQRRFPDDNVFAQRAYDVRLLMTGGEAAADAAALHGAEDAGSDPRAELRELVMRFESLGGRGIGCEFGMFQREFGAEPLGLLRWADMPYEGILQVLENRFEGVGDPANTEVFVNEDNERREYCTRDLRGFMFMRAFVYEDEMSMEVMRKQAFRRLGFLKDKLIGDLQAGSKIFIWRSTERMLEPHEIARLHTAVRSYGDNILLYVRLADATHPNGHVERRAPGLLVGYIDRFKLSPEGVLSSSPASASWLRLCRAALANAGRT